MTEMTDELYPSQEVEEPQEASETVLTDLRLHCLSMANHLDRTPKEVVQRAKEYFAFVIGPPTVSIDGTFLE